MPPSESFRQALNLKPEETRTVFYLWGFYGVLTMMLQMGDTISMALFLKRVGVLYLPWLFMAVALMNMIFTTLYTLVADRLGAQRIFLIALIWTGLGFLFSYFMVGVIGKWSFALFYMLRETAFTILVMHFGLYIRAFFTREATERTFPIIFASGRMGGLLAGLTVSFLAKPLGSAQLILVCAALSFVGIGLLKPLDAELKRHATETGKTGLQHSAENASSVRVSWHHFLDGLRYVFCSRLLMAMSMATLLFVVLRYCLNYEYSHIFNTIFTDEDKMAAFLGNYSIVALLFATLIQLLVTSRLIQQLGLAMVNQIFSVMMTLAFVGLLFAPGFYTALLARFTESELRMSLRNPIMNLFYNAVPENVRARSRAFTFGYVVPLATLFAGTGLQLAQTHLSLWTLAALGSGLSILFIFYTWRQGIAYQHNLDTLEAEKSKASAHNEF